MSCFLCHMGKPHEACIEGQVETLTELQRRDLDKDGYPLSLYLFDARGRYGRPTPLETQAELDAALVGPVRQAVEEKREVRICDPGDMLVFHAVDGRIVFPTPEDIAATRGAS